MAAAHVLHVGDESFHRASVLRAVGYAVDECGTLQELAAWFRQGNRTDVVCISEEPHRSAEGAIALARSKTAKPVVLFRSTERPYLQRGVDLEFPPLTPPDVWLGDLARLLAMTRASIARSEELRASSQQLRTEAGQVRPESQRLQLRMREQLEKMRRLGK
jgi:hypothetical protein